jgi:hypothetical protein
MEKEFVFFETRTGWLYTKFCLRARAVSRRPLAAEAGFRSQSMRDFWWTNCNWDRIFSVYFRCPLSASFHKCFSLNLISTVLLPEGQRIEVWEPSKKQCSFRNRKSLDRNLLSPFFPSSIPGQFVLYFCRYSGVRTDSSSNY